MSNLSEVKMVVLKLNNRELYDLLEFVKHEISLSERAIAEGFEVRK
jgi:hypothetical protein